ncbi:MAG: hypothetical protein WBA74_23120 [Cyclobacteriaceae bacterium]
MKNIMEIDKVKMIDKTTQKELNGGLLRLPVSQDCPTQCAKPTATNGEPCGSGTHCPGLCDGQGGYHLY